METLSELPALCEGNGSVVGGFPSQRDQKCSALMFSLWCQIKQAAQQTIELSMIWDIMTPMWRHSNELGTCITPRQPGDCLLSSTAAGISNTLARRNGRHFADNNFDVLFFYKIIVFWLKCGKNLFPMVPVVICQHWLWLWICAQKATSHYPNQLWRSLLTHVHVSVPRSPRVNTRCVATFGEISSALMINTVRPRWNRRHFADDIFKYIFLNENVWFFI